MLSRPWFQKRWIYQEISIAQSVVLHCGPKAVSSKAFAHALNILTDKIDVPIQAVLDLISGPRRDVRKAFGFHLYHFLRNIRHARVTDPRDKVYALQGLVEYNSWKMGIIPDSSMSHKSLIREVIANLCFCDSTSVPEPHMIRSMNSYRTLATSTISAMTF
jgi:hypothetical protein